MEFHHSWSLNMRERKVHSQGTIEWLFFFPSFSASLRSHYSFKSHCVVSTVPSYSIHSSVFLLFFLLLLRLSDIFSVATQEKLLRSELCLFSASFSFNFNALFGCSLPSIDGYRPLTAMNGNIGSLPGSHALTPPMWITLIISVDAIRITRVLNDNLTHYVVAFDTRLTSNYFLDARKNSNLLLSFRSPDQQRFSRL